MMAQEIDGKENVVERQVDCTYKGDTYSVRSDGSVMRHSKGGRPARKLDGVWTFGIANHNGYLQISGEPVHRIVATAFLGDAPTKSHVVDHINTNRQDNRPSNLRWVTRLENIMLNPITCKKIEMLTGMKIEDVLADISVLRKYSPLPDFSWMRTVTQEESDACLKSLTDWAKTVSVSKSSLGSVCSAEEAADRLSEEWMRRTIASLTPNAVQVYHNFKTPSEFPCIPKEIGKTPLWDYSDNLCANGRGNVFCRNEYFTSLVVQCALCKDILLVKTKDANRGAIKPFALAAVAFENGNFIHRVCGTYFNIYDANKKFMDLRQRVDRDGLTVFSI